MSAKASWRFVEGDQIVPERHVLRRLGGGERFEVYLATDERLSATVVCKILRPDRTGDAAALRALRNEADALARLAHPVIVRSFGSVLDGPRPHLVLEHLEGPTLRSLARRYGPLPLEQLVPLAVHLCSALHYMAEEGWVHLDVKPANVVMSLTPRLVDLSVARTLERAAALTSSVGTFDFMAPEQCEPGARGLVGPPADVWGLGVTLYRALTGSHPFTRADARAARVEARFPQLVEEPVPLPRKVPTILAEAVLACLRGDPADRPTASGVATALEPMVAAMPRKPILGRRRPRLR